MTLNDQNNTRNGFSSPNYMKTYITLVSSSICWKINPRNWTNNFVKNPNLTLKLMFDLEDDLELLKQDQKYFLWSKYHQEEVLALFLFLFV